MKMSWRLAALAAAAAVGAPAVSQAGVFMNDFNTDLGGITTTGSAGLDGGQLQLTPAENGQQGSAILPDLDPGTAIQDFAASFDLITGPGTVPPADGVSFVFGQFTGAESFGEEGPAMFNGLTVAFDTFDNGGGEAPAIEVKVNDVLVPGGRSTINPYTNGTPVPVTITLDATGALNLISPATGPIFTNLATGFVPEAGDRFGFGGRTGGLNERNAIDNLSVLTVVPEPAALGLLGLLGLGALGLLNRRRRS